MTAANEAKAILQRLGVPNVQVKSLNGRICAGKVDACGVLRRIMAALGYLLFLDRVSNAR